jgi:hypothetical protein
MYSSALELNQIKLVKKQINQIDLSDPLIILSSTE